MLFIRLKSIFFHSEKTIKLHLGGGQVFFSFLYFYCTSDTTLPSKTNIKDIFKGKKGGGSWPAPGFVNNQTILYCRPVCASDGLTYDNDCARQGVWICTGAKFISSSIVRNPPQSMARARCHLDRRYETAYVSNTPCSIYKCASFFSRYDAKNM